MNLARSFQQYAPLTEGDSNRAAWQLLQVRDFLGRQWRLIALATALALVLGVAYLAVTPSRYTAQLDMVIDTKRITWSQSELATENRIVEDASVESEIETTKSERVILSVIHRLHLNEDPEFIGAGVQLRISGRSVVARVSRDTSAGNRGDDPFGRDSADASKR